MNRADRQSLRSIVACLVLIAPCGSSFAADPKGKGQDYGPDPASVRRFGTAYRYPKAGWIVLHVEGEPYERGYQHGRLLAPEIAEYVKAVARQRSSSNPSEGWKGLRTLVDALFLRRYDKEYLEEMKGTADGASAAGATFDGRALDLLDIVAINSEIEVGCLEGALEASAHGLEGKVFSEPSLHKPKAPKVEHCSAFAANGSATVDGQVVIGHTTMWSLSTSRFFNVWLDVKPSQGHRVLMQTYPGGIQSGMDYYQNDVGLVVTETTIGQTRFNPEGQPLASRIRKAMQYGDSIDSIVAVLSKKNNGLYSNEWLLADTKTNEIAMFELGTHKSKLWRSSKKEWFGGTEGFYWGCNNAKDIDVRLETVASVEAQPVNLVWNATDRDRIWVSLFAENKGKINADFGFKAFATPTLSSSSSLDAKFTTSSMAKDLKHWGLFGPPLGRAWEPNDWERSLGVKPLINNDWTTLTGENPVAAPDGMKTAVDLTDAPHHSSDHSQEVHTPVWHGTILPKSDADTWLAAAFADYEPMVAHEKSLGDDAFEGEPRQRIELALYGPRSRYLAAARRLGKDIPLSKIQADVASSDWYEIAAGKGVLLLAALRQTLGSDQFAIMMDDFGRHHAGQAVETAQFRSHVEKASPDKPVKEMFDRWLDQTGLPDAPELGTWAVDSYDWEPERAMIVYGSTKEVHANGEAARRLQRAIATRWSNVIVPIKSDTEVTDEDWKSHHILLVGRPETNSAVERTLKTLPAAFGPASFKINDETYAHPGSAVIMAGDNPSSPRFSVVIFAGLSAEATWHCVEQLGGRHAPAIILADGASPYRLIARTTEKKLAAAR